jgi:hypothetical protein
MNPLPHWHRDTPTTPTPRSPGTRVGRSQAALAFGPRPSVFGRPERQDGAAWSQAADDEGRMVATWGASSWTTKTKPVALVQRRRRRR